MHGIRKIEDTLLNNYKKTSPLILIAILALYIMNVNNHYQLFMDANEKLRNEIESYRYDYQTADRFIRKIFNHSNLIGRKIHFFDKHVLGDNYKIVAILSASYEAIINKNVIRIVNNIENEKTGIKIIKFSDNSTGFAENIHVNLNKLSFINRPSIFLLGDQNQILSAFSLDGTESAEEIQLVSRYILKIVPGQQ